MLVMALAGNAAAASAKSKPEEVDRSPWSVFPILGYSPETSAMFGGGAVYTFDVDGEPERDPGRSRRSAVALATAYTVLGQFFLSLSPSVYWNAEAWHAEGELSGKHFPSTFFPIGNDTAEERAEEYTERAFGAVAALTRRLAGSLRSGGQVAVLHSTITRKDPGGDLARDRVAGSDGGLLVGFGPVLLWDDRDNDFATRRGTRTSLSATSFGTPWGSDFNVSKYELDARQFFPLGGEHVLGTQLYAVANLGTVPFQTMAALGGANRMRGFFEGRYRDHCMVAAQVEHRFPLIWRFGGAVFGGAGEVAHAIDGFRADGVKLAGGAGLRFSLNPADRVNLRFDAAATSTADVNFYVTLGEAF